MTEHSRAIDQAAFQEWAQKSTEAKAKCALLALPDGLCKAMFDNDLCRDCYKWVQACDL